MVATVATVTASPTPINPKILMNGTIINDKAIKPESVIIVTYSCLLRARNTAFAQLVIALITPNIARTCNI